MSPADLEAARVLEAGLATYSRVIRKLPGVSTAGSCQALAKQIVESIRRVRFVSVIRDMDLSPLRKDPSSDLFDPVRAAVLHSRSGAVEEAFWLVFLSVHFGKSFRTGWRLARDVYGALGDGQRWDWRRTSSNPMAFRSWLEDRQLILQGRDGVARRFGNHRKYESLSASSDNGTGNVIQSYVDWVMGHGSHSALLESVMAKAAGDSRTAFHLLYQSIRAVRRFGRTAKFDYLTMIGKIGLGSIEPGYAYLREATGPLRGARLLFGGDAAGKQSPDDLEVLIRNLVAELNVGAMAMQVMEDALCNWQKSPDEFVPFRG